MSTKDSKTEQPCTLHGVSGSITFSEHSRGDRYRQCRSILKFFEGEIRFKEYEDCIVFRKPSIDDNDSIKTTPHKGGYKFNIKCNIPLGNFKIDREESTEDELVIYYH